MRSEKRRFFAPNKCFNDTSPKYVHGRDQSARGTVNSIFNRFVSNYTPTHVVSVKTQAILLIDHPWLRRIIISKYCFRTLLKTLWDNRGHENGVLHPSPHPVALCCHWGCPSVMYKRYFVYGSETLEFKKYCSFPEVAYSDPKTRQKQCNHNTKFSTIFMSFL